jgi:hypothetical protein
MRRATIFITSRSAFKNVVSRIGQERMKTFSKQASCAPSIRCIVRRWLECSPNSGDSEQSSSNLNVYIKFYEANFAKIKRPPIRNHSKSRSTEVYRLRAGLSRTTTSTSEFADLAKFIEYAPTDFHYRIRAKIYLDHDTVYRSNCRLHQSVKKHFESVIFFLKGAMSDAAAGSKIYEEAIRDYEEASKKDAGLTI